MSTVWHYWIPCFLPLGSKFLHPIFYCQMKFLLQTSGRLLHLLGYSGIDAEFEKLLANIFGRDFIETYKLRRPSGWTDLMVAFESRKRSAHPNKSHPLNVCLPFSFIEQHNKLRVCVRRNCIRMTSWLLFVSWCVGVSLLKLRPYFVTYVCVSDVCF